MVFSNESNAFCMQQEFFMPRKIDAILFDFGGVFTGSPFHAVESASSELGLAAGLLTQLVFGSYDTDTDHPWHRLERGEISFVEARESIIRLASKEGVTLDPMDLLLRTASGEGPRQLLIERVRALRAEGYLTAIVTNNVAEFRQGWRSLLPIDELFNAIIDSSEVGMRKPDPGIFRLTLERLGGVTPARAVFLDDYIGNIDVATRLGLHGILVGEDPSEAIQQLDAILES